jgi:glutamate synthase (NADPH) small chain
VRKAFEIELGGHAFYERAAREARARVAGSVRPLCRDGKRTHGHAVEALPRDLPAAAEDFQLDRAAIFAGIERNPEDPANLFRIAIAFEQRAVDFFAREGERAPEGSVERELYRELAAEEREHVALLTTEYRRWQAGKAGIL